MFLLTQQSKPLSLAVDGDSALLQQCLAADIPVARSCRNGNCGRCDTELLDGRVTLRGGKIVNAPATIPLCLATPCSDLLVTALPLASQQTHWRCQQLGPAQLQLPAGRQQGPRKGDLVAIFSRDCIVISEVLHARGRELQLREDIPLQKATVGVLLIDLKWQGDYSLWRDDADTSYCLWANINASTAQAALQLARKDGRQYHLENAK